MGYNGIELIPVLVSWDLYWCSFYPQRMTKIVVSNYGMHDESQQKELVQILLHRNWDRVIIDNSAYSLYQARIRGRPCIVPTNQMARLHSQFAIANIIPSSKVTIIAPDFINNPVATRDSFIQTLKVFNRLDETFPTIPSNIDSIMLVSQGHDLATRKQSFLEASYFAQQYRMCDLKPIIGIPTSPLSIPEIPKMISAVNRWNAEALELHLLGANLLDYYVHACLAGFSSADTSYPFHQVLDPIKERYRNQYGITLPRVELKKVIAEKAEEIGSNYANFFLGIDKIVEVIV